MRRASVAVVVALGLWGCGTDVVSGGMTQGQVVGVLQAMNQAEIQEARAAQPRLTGSARDYANKMVADHTAALGRLQALGIAAEPSSASADQAAHGQATADGLARTSRAKLNQAYLQSQALGHDANFDVINTLIQNATDPRVVQEVYSTRTTLAEHERLAVKDLASPGGTGGGGASAP